MKTYPKYHARYYNELGKEVDVLKMDGRKLLLRRISDSHSYGKNKGYYSWSLYSKFGLDKGNTVIRSSDQTLK